MTMVFINKKAMSPTINYIIYFVIAGFLIWFVVTYIIGGSVDALEPAKDFAMFNKNQACQIKGQINDDLPDVTTAPPTLSSSAIFPATSSISFMNSGVMTFIGLSLTSTVTMAMPSASTL